MLACVRATVCGDGGVCVYACVCGVVCACVMEEKRPFDQTPPTSHCWRRFLQACGRGRGGQVMARNPDSKCHRCGYHTHREWGERQDINNNTTVCVCPHCPQKLSEARARELTVLAFREMHYGKVILRLNNRSKRVRE